MSKYQFTKEQYKEVLKTQKQVKDKNPLRKLQVIQLRMEGYKDREIAEITKYHKDRVSQICCDYAKYGITLFTQENRKGGNNRNISIEEEAQMLEEFRQKAQAGQIITVQEIKAVYEEKIGHESGGETIYRVLKRQGWRKIMPRSKHPKKASDEEIESSKKLSVE